MLNIEFVDNAIKEGIEGRSGIGESELAIGGFSTPTMRRIFNNLCNIDGKYLEVGLWMGGTFVSSFNKNCMSIGVEDFSQDFGVVGVKDILEKHIKDHYEKPKQVVLFYQPCFKVEGLPRDIDIFFYDGNHSEENQAKALPYFLDNMAKTFLLIIDDIAWKEVASGTEKGFEELKDKIFIEMAWVLKGTLEQEDPIFHNGLGIFLIHKKIDS